MALGVSVMANEFRIRQGVHNLSTADVAALRSAYSQMMALDDRDDRSWFAHAGIHGDPGHKCWHYQHSDPSSPNLELFLPWHRAYLYNFEMAVRDRVANATLPWWDWTLRPPRQNGVPTIFSDRTVNGSPNPLFNFKIDTRVGPGRGEGGHVTTRHPGPVNRLPTSQQVQDVITLTDWNEFSDGLEDIHDGVHGWVSGDMGIINLAAFDPLFWSHHCMIDRIWWLWQVRNGNGNIPKDLLGAVLPPFNMQVRDVLNVHDLGYDYAAANSIDIPGGDD
jgi:tyrosinase